MGLLPEHVVNLLDTESPHKYLHLRKSTIYSCLAGFLVPIIIPFLHFGVVSHLWDEYNFHVDRLLCGCSCWDTVFKGIYERGPAGYKHVYFNVTPNTFKIWIVTVLAIILAYEALKRVAYLHFRNQVRLSMVLLFACSLFPHYYAWWAYFNYWNDDFYGQWNHQFFFTLTEMMSSFAVLYLMDKRVPVTARSTLSIMSIATMHILCAGFDQFVDNVISGNGMLHQILRDVFFMVPDVLHVTLPLLELKKVARELKTPVVCLISNREFFGSIGFIAGGWFINLLL